MSVVLAGAKLALHTDNRRPRFGLLLGLAVARGGEQSNGVGRHLKLLLQLRRLHLDRPDLNVVPGAAPIRNVSCSFRLPGVKAWNPKGLRRGHAPLPQAGKPPGLAQ